MRHVHLNRLAPLLFLTISIAIVHARASVVDEVGIGETVKTADTILIGTVDRIEYAADSQTVFTRVTLRDIERIKGAVPDRFPVIRLPGGIWNGNVHRLVGYPILELGNRYALCLRSGFGSQKDNYHSIVFWNQGFFPLMLDSLSGRLVAHDAGFRPIVSINNGNLVVIGRPARMSRSEMRAYERQLKRAHPGSQMPDTIRGYNGVARIVLPFEGDTGERLDEAEFARELRRLAGQ